MEINVLSEPSGFCPQCGYRMDPGRCPECGENVPASRIRTRKPWCGRSVARSIGILLLLVAFATLWMKRDFVARVLLSTDDLLCMSKHDTRAGRWAFDVLVERIRADRLSDSELVEFGRPVLPFDGRPKIEAEYYGQVLYIKRPKPHVLGTCELHVSVIRIVEIRHNGYPIATKRQRRPRFQMGGIVALEPLASADGAFEVEYEVGLHAKPGTMGQRPVETRLVRDRVRFTIDGRVESDSAEGQVVLTVTYVPGERGAE